MVGPLSEDKISVSGLFIDGTEEQLKLSALKGGDHRVLSGQRR